MSGESQPQSEGILDRLRKRQKEDPIEINLNPQNDIQELAVARYAEIKKNYQFVTFEEADKSKKVASGSYEGYKLPMHDFNEEMYRFRRDGFCSNPDTTNKALVFSSKNPELKDKVELEGEEINPKHPIFLAEVFDKTTKQAKKELSKKFKNMREKADGALDYMGPWAGYGENLENGALTTEQKEMLESAQERKKIRIEQSKKEEENFEPYSTFHRKEYHDYKGQSYLDPPSDFKPSYGNCYLPKKDIHTWVNSQKTGFQVARFFPKVGHFILVGNPEGKVQLYDCTKDYSNVHTYVGHTKAIRDIQFTNDGKHFLSCAFDGQVHYWDAEYGKVLRTFKLKRIPFCVRFHPASDKQNSFLCGSNNKKILQFDLNTGTKEFEYSQHLGTINTITFIEENKFASTADDKKLFLWQFGIPVVIKHVSEPQMHTITSTAVHPNGQFFAGQSSDNQIVIYENKGGNFRRIRSKKFASHFCAGYACGIDFSHDGQFLCSGDERGRLFCYDWKTSKNYRTLDAHPSVCIGVEFHPSDPTKMVTCGWEGLVKLWA